MTIAAECKCGNVGGYCNGGEGCFFKPVSAISKEIRSFSADQIQQRISELESENTVLKLEVEKYRQALNKIRFFNVGQSKPKDRWEEGYDSGCTQCRTLAEQALKGKP